MNTVIIDGNSLINRAFYALPLLTNDKGEYSNAVYGFCNMLIKMITDKKPDHIVVAFDYGKKNFRHKLYEEYKGTRKATPDELRGQFAILKNILNQMNITYIEKEGIEADDIIGTLSKKFDGKKFLLSGDRDLLQLIDENTSVWLTKKGISDIEEININNIVEKFELTAPQIIDFKALSGDASDNIPGVKGIGEKTAKSLLHEYTTLENIYNNIDNLKGSTKQKLLDNKDMAFLSKQLATIETNAELKISEDKCSYDFPFNKEVYLLCKQYNFNSLLRRQDLFVNDIFNEVYTTSIDLKNSKTFAPKKVVITNIDEFINTINKDIITKFAFVLTDNKLNFAFSDEIEYEVEIINSLFTDVVTFEVVINELKKVLSNKNIQVIMFGYKNFIRKYKLEISNLLIDEDLAYYLISGGQKSTIDKVTNTYGDMNYLATSLYFASETMLQELKNLKLEKLYYDVELPLMYVLLDMENNGIKIDINLLEKLSKKYTEELNELKQKLKDVAGEDVNINSPKQLSELLFDKLNLSTRGNKKHSTSVEMLEKLVEDHPIIPLILRYRTVSKMLSTYLESFKPYLDKNNKIHTIFNQTLTSTGRLSSSEPNLQNIPIRTEEGKQLRGLFIPSFDNGFIISADYSQIELRIMAHLSADEGLIKAFNMGKDIHSSVACEVFNVTPDQVTPLMRRQAKAINFGIIYGMSSFGLGDNLGISAKEASKYMDYYFSKYPSVKEYMNKCIETCKANNGETRTMFNRIRKIPEIFSTNGNIRLFGERASLNSPIQGTASDIIKIAMINVYNRLKKENLKTKLILQIHDELVLDVPSDELDIAKQILKEEMQNAVNLSVPLTCEVNYGKSLADCK